MKKLQPMRVEVLSQEEFRKKQIEIRERRLAEISYILKNPPSYWSTQTINFWARQKIEIMDELNELRVAKS